MTAQRNWASHREPDPPAPGRKRPCFFTRRAFRPLVHRQLSLLITLTAWLLATGSQWDAVQTFAFGRMWIVNARTLPLLDAAERTFSPEGRCLICAAVTAAKQQEENSAAVPEGRAGGKIFLLYQPAPAPVVAAPAFSPWSPSDPLVRSLGRAAPPLPPPRTLA